MRGTIGEVLAVRNGTIDSTLSSFSPCANISKQSLIDLKQFKEYNRFIVIKPRILHYRRHFHATFVSPAKITRAPSSMIEIENDGWIKSAAAIRVLQHQIQHCPLFTAFPYSHEQESSKINCNATLVFIENSHKRGNIPTPTSSMRTISRISTDT